MATFVIYIDRAGEYRWVLIAKNGEKIAASEGYTSKQGAIAAANRIKLYAPAADIVDNTL